MGQWAKGLGAWGLGRLGSLPLWTPWKTEERKTETEDGKLENAKIRGRGSDRGTGRRGGDQSIGLYFGTPIIELAVSSQMPAASSQPPVANRQ